MSTPSAEDVKEQMESESGRGPDSYIAKRSVLAWQKSGQIPANSDITHLVKLYMSLKKLLGADGGRLTAQCFSNYTRTISHSRSLKRKLWVVPVANTLKIEMALIQGFIINKDTVEEMPQFMKLDDCILIDQAVPQSSLGAGVTEFEVQVSDTSQCVPPPDSTQSGGGSGHGAGSSGATAHGAGSSGTTPVAVVHPPAKRTLEREDSVTDQDAAEHIATVTKDAFDRGDLVSSNKLQVTIAHSISIVVLTIVVVCCFGKQQNTTHKTKTKTKANTKTNTTQQTKTQHTTTHNNNTNHKHKQTQPQQQTNNNNTQTQQQQQHKQTKTNKHNKHNKHTTTQQHTNQQLCNNKQHQTHTTPHNNCDSSHTAY
jgi:hypothetical protein